MRAETVAENGVQAAGDQITKQLFLAGVEPDCGGSGNVPFGAAIRPYQTERVGDFLHRIIHLSSTGVANGVMPRLTYDRKIFDERPYGTPVASYTVHGSTIFNPAASNGAVSRVATIMPLAAAVAAM